MSCKKWDLTRLENRGIIAGFALKSPCRFAGWASRCGKSAQRIWRKWFALLTTGPRLTGFKRLWR